MSTVAKKQKVSTGVDGGDEGGCDSNSTVDILAELMERNMHHVLEAIVAHLDFQSILKMFQVCRKWNASLSTPALNPWQSLLKVRMRTKPLFKRACDLNDWTKYIMSSDPMHFQRIKYIAYVGIFISEKQRVLRGTWEKRLDQGDYGLGSYTMITTERLEKYSYRTTKVMADWLFGCNDKVLAWNLSHPGTMRLRSMKPKKVFYLPSPLESEDKPERKDYITTITSNSEFKPWEKLEQVAVACRSKAEDDRSHYFVIWSFETCAVLHKMSREHEIVNLKLDSDIFVVVRRERELEPLSGLCKTESKRLIIEVYDKDHQITQQFEHTCALNHFITGDKIFLKSMSHLSNDQTLHCYEQQGHQLNHSELSLGRFCPSFSQFFGNTMATIVTTKLDNGWSTKYILSDVADSNNNPTSVLEVDLLSGEVDLKLCNNSIQISSECLTNSPAKPVHAWSSPIEDILSESGRAELLHEFNRASVTRDEANEYEGEITFYVYRYGIVPSSPTFIVTKAVQDETIDEYHGPKPSQEPPTKIHVIDLRAVRSASQ